MDEEVSNAQGIALARANGFEQVSALDLWRCGVCYAVVSFPDIPHHIKWHKRVQAAGE